MDGSATIHCLLQIFKVGQVIAMEEVRLLAENDAAMPFSRRMAGGIEP
jgi:hypothetical protein